jgi:hypothetical protein
MQLSDQIVEVSHIAENKKDSCLSGGTIREKCGILPHPSSAECYILPHDLSPQAWAKSCESISFTAARNLDSSMCFLWATLSTAKSPHGAYQYGFFTVAQRFSDPRGYRGTIRRK